MYGSVGAPVGQPIGVTQPGSCNVWIHDFSIRQGLLRTMKKTLLAVCFSLGSFSIGCQPAEKAIEPTPKTAVEETAESEPKLDPQVAASPGEPPADAAPRYS